VREGAGRLSRQTHTVKDILKEVKALGGCHHAQAGVGAHGHEGETTAIWVVDPRSLVDIMDADYISPVSPPSTPEEQVRPP